MSDRSLTNGSILIIDDEPCNIRFLDRLLRRNGYTRIHSTTSPKEGLDIFSSAAIDLVLLDLGMPGMDGFKVMAEMKRLMAAGDYVPILVLTGNPRPEIRNQALANGARDFLAKPFDPSEALLRIENLLDTRYLQRTLARHNETLEARVRERTGELEEAQLEILSRLAMVAEYYDDDTAEHTRRVASLSEQIARELGMADADATLLGHAALVHDVGKIAVPAGLTRKPGRLDSTERHMMQRHAVEGARVLSGSRLPLMRLAEEVARTHHERWNGMGYPDGLAGEAIPLSGRIVAVADVFDALTNTRPYKCAWGEHEAIAEIRAGAGSSFDARVVQALERILARQAAAPVQALIGRLRGAAPVQASTAPATSTAPAPPAAPASPAAPAARAETVASSQTGGVRRSVIAALLTVGALLPAPCTASAQEVRSVSGMASVTIAPVARITARDERVLPAADGERSVELKVAVRANAAYRVVVTLPRDVGEGVVAWVETDEAPLALRGGHNAVVAARGQGPGHHTHMVTIRFPERLAPTPGASVVVQVDVD
jgi:putative two-component system response regulator